jgi:predicted transposase YbfD/YdcC
LSRERADAGQLLALARGHWGAIENGTHWVRDVTMDEDRCTIFRGHAPQNFAAFRNAALNWLRRTGTRNLAAKIRSLTRNSQRLFAKFGYVN